MLSHQLTQAAQWTAGPGCMMGKDHTIFAVEDGLVKFEKSSVRQRISIVQPEPVDESIVLPETRRTRKFAKCARCATLRRGALPCSPRLAGFRHVLRCQQRPWTWPLLGDDLLAELGLRRGWRCI